MRYAQRAAVSLRRSAPDALEPKPLLRRPGQRPDALRTPADDAGLCPGHGEHARRRPLHVPLQPRHRSADVRVRRREQLPLRPVQSGNAQGERGPGGGARPCDVHARNEPLRRRGDHPGPRRLLFRLRGQHTQWRSECFYPVGFGQVLPSGCTEGHPRPLDRDGKGRRPERMQQSPHSSPVWNPKAAGAGRQPDRVHPRAGGNHHLHLLDGNDLKHYFGRVGSLESLDS